MPGTESEKARGVVPRIQSDRGLGREGDEDLAARSLLLSISTGRGYVQAMRTLADDTAPQTERVLI
jgi:hypothetical protein